jgi:hypothetical protein
MRECKSGARNLVWKRIKEPFKSSAPSSLSLTLISISRQMSPAGARIIVHVPGRRRIAIITLNFYSANSAVRLNNNKRAACSRRHGNIMICFCCTSCPQHRVKRTAQTAWYATARPLSFARYRTYGGEIGTASQMGAVIIARLLGSWVSSNF